MTPNPIVSCPACESGELRPGPLVVRCSGCGYALSRGLFLALRRIRALPETEQPACRCAHPDTRRLPSGVLRCPACGAEEEIAMCAAPKAARRGRGQTAPKKGDAFLIVPPAPPFPQNLHMEKMCGVVWCYTGPAERAEEVFAPVQEFGPPALHGVQPMPYPALQSAFDALYPPALQWYWRADFVNELSDEAIELHVEHGSKVPTMHLYPIDGAAHRAGKHDTAFGYLDARWAEVIVDVGPHPASAQSIKDWTVAYWNALHPYSAGGAYVNFMMDEGQERVKATYRDDYERLVAVRNEYDPTNLFRVNQNIKPGG